PVAQRNIALLVAAPARRQRDLLDPAAAVGFTRRRTHRSAGGAQRRLVRTLAATRELSCCEGGNIWARQVVHPQGRGARHGCHGSANRRDLVAWISRWTQ